MRGNRELSTCKFCALQYRPCMHMMVNGCYKIRNQLFKIIIFEHQKVKHVAGAATLSYVRSPTSAWITSAEHLTCAAPVENHVVIDQWLLGAPYQGVVERSKLV